VEAGSVRVWTAIGALAHREGVPASLRHAVRACADSLGAAGAALSVGSGGTRSEPLLACGAIAGELEELQFTLGEGPCMDAAAGRRPVLVPDLAIATARGRWPAFAPAAVGHGIRAIFAFPVTAGAALVGVLGVYQDHPGSLPRRELADALVFADAMLVLASDEQGGIAAGVDNALALQRAQVHQATGMVAAQLNVPVTDALAALRAHAYTRGLRLSDLAADVVARRVRLSDGDRAPRHLPLGSTSLGATSLGATPPGSASPDDADPPAPPSSIAPH
jgi:GAF domain/ANTAR domain